MLINVFEKWINPANIIKLYPLAGDVMIQYNTPDIHDDRYSALFTRIINKTVDQVATEINHQLWKQEIEKENFIDQIIYKAEQKAWDDQKKHSYQEKANQPINLPKARTKNQTYTATQTPAADASVL